MAETGTGGPQGGSQRPTCFGTLRASGYAALLQRTPSSICFPPVFLGPLPPLTSEAHDRPAAGQPHSGVVLFGIAYDSEFGEF